MNKKFYMVLFFAIVGVSLSSCDTNGALSTGNNDETSMKDDDKTESSSTDDISTGTTDTQTFTINIYDIDDELLNTKTLSKGNKSLFEELDNSFDVNATESQYGHYISSIDKQIVDNNYFVAIYENGVSSEVGIDSIVIDDNDVFDFKMECWNTVDSEHGTMDSYDVLVDKTIYGYAKNDLNASLAKATLYSNADFWGFMSVNLMTSNGYDTKAFNANSVTAEFKSNLEAVDVNTLNNANIGKYYYAAKALGLDLTDFTSFYTDYITNTLSTAYTNYGEYNFPFMIPMAKTLNIASDRLTSLLATDYFAGTDYGYDGLCWQLASNSAFDGVYDNSVLNRLPKAVQANGTSQALMLLPYAAMGVSPRTEEYDYVKVLFDEYYDSSLNLVKYKKADTTTQMSTNQIYASLMAYKVARDSGNKAYLFA